jgi:peroxiredoxin
MLFKEPFLWFIVMRKGLFLIIILLFPSIIYMLFSLGEHRVEKIRSYGQFEMADNGDTVFLPVPELRLVDDNGSVFSVSDLRGKPIVLDVFTMPCDQPCMKKGVTLVNYLNELPERDQWVVLSLSLSPDLNQESLKMLRNQHLPEMENWMFVSALDSTELNAFLSYLFVETNQEASLKELPSKYFALIDQQGVIRSFFDSRIYKENRKLEDAIKLLLQEPYLTWKEKKK